MLKYMRLNKIKIDQIVEMGQQLGVENFGQTAVRASLNVQVEDLSVEELIELDADPNIATEDKDEDVIVEEEQPRKLSQKAVVEFLSNIDQTCDKFLQMDPDFQRASTFRQNIESAVSTYREFLETNRNEFEKKQKQKSMTDFFSKQ